MAKGISKKLELAKYMSEFEVKEKDDEYLVSPRDQEICLAASISKSAIPIVEYYVTGVYNSGCDWELIDIDALNKLQEFVKILLED